MSRLLLLDVRFGDGGRHLMDYYIALILLMCIACTVSGSIMGDECDWTGSGLANNLKESGRGVTPVYLRCTTGRIKWLYPRGALRVLLRLPSQEREFRACIKLHPDRGAQMPARLFLEGPRSLLPLYDDGAKQLVRCFNSKNKELAIFAETTQVDAVERRIFEFEYDLQALPRGVQNFNRNEECRPCTSNELAHAFCTSDLVARGTIHALDNDESAETTRMTVKITKLIHQTSLDFLDIETNNIEGEISHSSKVLLNVPLHCGVTHGLGEFVFMARRKLGELTLSCAPRFEDWALMVHKLSDEGKAHCVLKS